MDKIEKPHIPDMPLVHIKEINEWYKKLVNQGVGKRTIIRRLSIKSKYGSGAIRAALDWWTYADDAGLTKDTGLAKDKKA